MKQLGTLIVLVDKIVDFIFKHIDKQLEFKREEERDELHEDPVDWFNDRYGKRVRDDQEHIGESDADPDDTKTER